MADYYVALDGTVTKNKKKRKKADYQVSLDGTVTKNFQEDTTVKPSLTNSRSSDIAPVATTTSKNTLTQESARALAEQNILKQYGTYEQFLENNKQKANSTLTKGLSDAHNTLSKSTYEKLISDETNRLLSGSEFYGLTNTAYQEYLDNIQKNATDQKQHDWLKKQKNNLNALADENVKKAVADYVEGNKNFLEYMKKNDGEYALKQLGYSDEEIKSMADTYKREQNAERNTKMMEKADNATDSGIVGKIGAHLMSIGAGVVSAPSILGNAGAEVKEIITGEYAPVDTNAYAYMSGNYKERVRGNIEQDITKEEEYAEQEEKTPVWRKGLGMVYQGGASAVDSLLLSPVPGGMAIMGAEAAGRTSKDVFERTGSNTKALTTGVVAGGIETATEKMGLDNLWDIMKGSGKAATRSALANILAQSGIEGTEEMTSETLNTLADWIINKADSNLELNVQNYKDNGKAEKEAWSAAVIDALKQVGEAGLTGAIAGGIGGGIASSISTDTLTDNEQKVIDKEVERRIAEKEADETKVTLKEKKAIIEQVQKDLEKGYISIDTIESTLGGETYNSYKSVVDQESKLQEEIKKLEEMPNAQITVKQNERLQEARKQLEELQQNSNKTQLKDQLSKEVQELIKNDKLSESYNEKSRRSQTFETDVSKYDAKQRATIQKAIDSGILNNTNRTHEFVDMIAKISADKGVSFDFTDNQRLKESGFAKEGVSINGYIKDGNVTLNVNSAKALNKVVGHEITHVLEGSDLYAELQEAVKAYATTKGEYKSKLEAITKLYEGVEGANVEQELTADLIGEYLFTDEAFVQQLSTQNRNVFQKIYDEIKYLVKTVTSGSKEAKQLEKVKKIFDEVYRENTQIPKNDKVKYYLSKVPENHIRLSEMEKTMQITNKKYYVPKEFKSAIMKEGDIVDVEEFEIVRSEVFKKANSARMSGQPIMFEDYVFSSNHIFYYSNYTETEFFVEKIIEIDDALNSELEEEYNAQRKQRNSTRNSERDGTLKSFEGNNAWNGQRDGHGGTSTGNVEILERKATEQTAGNGESKRIAFVENNSEKMSSDDGIFFDEKNSSDLKQKQLDIVLKTNQADNDYVTWIRKKDDILTFEEALNSDDYIDYKGDDFDPSYPYSIAEEALRTGKITVYSSYPIKQGVFVSPSYMEAQSYSGNGRVYSKEVNLTDVAWIDPTQGQYANTSEKYSLSNDDIAPSGNWKVKGSDLALDGAPIRQDIAPAQKQDAAVDDMESWQSDEDFMTNKIRDTADRINGLERPKPNEGYALTNGISNNSIPQNSENTTKKFDDIAPVPIQAQEIQSFPDDFAPIAEDEKGKQRKWVETSTESDVVNREILPKDLDPAKITYQPISNKATLDKANSKLGNFGYERTVEYFNNKIMDKSTSLEDIVLGERLIQEAMKRGDTQTAGELIQDVAILGTELGQKVQALSIINRLTPAGQLKMLQKTVLRGKAKGDKAFEGVEITQEMIDYILSTYGENGAYNQKELNQVIEEVKQQIADQMQVTKMEKVNAWRYLSMLGNPKTHIRNIVSNVAMKGTLAVKNAISRTIEGIAPIENRTKTWRRASESVKEFARQTTLEMKDDITGEGKYSNDTSIKAKRDIFKNGVLQKVYDFNSDMLAKEDWWFSKSAFRSSFQEFLTANGIRTEEDIENNAKIVEKGKQYALEQSQIATFRQYSWLASKISDIENKNLATQVAIGSVLPFKKTPINVAKAGLNYSPLGFTKTLTYDIAQVKKGDLEASALVDHLAQNITGTGLAVAGYFLASSGLLNGGGEDDKEGTYDYYLGEQAYSLNIDGNTYSLSWLSPVAMPLFVGANAYEQLVEGKEWNADVVMETLAQTLDPLSEMSFLSSLDDVLSSYDSGVEKFMGMGKSAMQNYVTQFVPTLSSQVAATIDDTKRSTKVSADSGMKMIDEVINQLKYKIPVLRETLEPSTDIWGNEVKQSDSILERGVNNFFAPWSEKEGIATDVDAELKKLYGEVGDNGLLPSIPYNYVNFGGEKYKMSAEEHTQFKQTYGQTAKELMEELFATTTYGNASSEEKADMVNRVYDYAGDVAKKEYLAKEGVEYTNATKDGVKYYKENSIKDAVEKDLTIEEFDLYITNPGKYAVSKAVGGYKTYNKYTKALNGIIGNKDSNGNTVSGSRKQKVINYINGLEADYGEKLILFKNEYPADDTYNAEIVEYLNKRSDISYSDMETILKELGFTVDSDGTVRW